MSKEPNPPTVDEYISNAALNRKPIFKAYKRLCSIYGTVDYVEYEWKYYQFLHGIRDISIEKSSDNSSHVSFNDLPIIVVKKVLENLDMITCLVVRKVSKDLRQIVDQSKLKCKELMLFFEETCAELHLDKWRVRYDEEDGVKLSRKKSRDSYYNEEDVKWKKFDNPVDVFERMIGDAMTILNNRKLEIDYFEVQTENVELPIQLVTSLESLNFQIKAKELNLSLESYSGSIIPILKSIRPKTLNKIYCDSRNQEMDKIMEMEQVKKAEIFEWTNIPNGFPIEKLFHFEQFSVEELQYLSEDLLINIRDTLLKLPKFESCTLYVRIHEPQYDDDEDIEWELIDKMMSQNPGYDSRTHRLMIPNSNEYFKFSICSADGASGLTVDCLEIKRKTKNKKNKKKNKK